MAIIAICRTQNAEFGTTFWPRLEREARHQELARVLFVCARARGPSADTRRDQLFAYCCRLNAVQRGAKSGILVPEVGPNTHKVAKVDTLLKSCNGKVPKGVQKHTFFTNCVCTFCAHFWTTFDTCCLLLPLECRAESCKHELSTQIDTFYKLCTLLCRLLPIASKKHWKQACYHVISV